MTALYKLKEWMPLNEGAAYLSSILRDNITERELLDLAVQKAVALSIVIPTSFSANQYKPVALDEADVVVWPTQSTDGDEQQPELISRAEAIRRNLAYQSIEPFTVGDTAYKYVETAVSLPAGVYDIDDLGLGPNLLSRALAQTDNRYPVLEAESKHLMIRDTQGNLFEITKSLHDSDLAIFSAERFPEQSRLAIRPVHLQSLERKVTETRRVTSDQDHISAQLRLLEQASWEFWSSADRDDRKTFPTNQSVTDWLIQQGFSKNLAEAGASIIRPNWAKQV